MVWGRAGTRWLILVVMVRVRVVLGATRTDRVLVLRLVRVSRLSVSYLGPRVFRVTIRILDGFVTTLTLMWLKIRCPVVVIQVPLGLATTLIGVTAVALQVTVVTVRVLLTW